MTHDTASIKRIYFNSVILWFSMVMAVIVYGVFAYVVVGKYSKPVVYQDALMAMRAILAVLAVPEIFFARTLTEKIFMKKMQGQDEPNIEPRKLLIATIIEAAFCEAAVIYGLILAMVAKNFYEIIPFMVIGLTGFVFYFPQKSQWAEKLGVHF